jgi:hypothetical protein
LPCVVAPESPGSNVIMSNSMLLAAGKHCWDWWEENNLISEYGMIMIESQVYMMFTTTSQHHSL